MSGQRTKKFPWCDLLQRRHGVSSSRVCLLNTGIMAEFLVDRYVAGESIQEIAEDYYVSPTLIEAAIRVSLYVRGTDLTTRRALRKLDVLVPIREPYPGKWKPSQKPRRKR